MSPPLWGGNDFHFYWKLESYNFTEKKKIFIDQDKKKFVTITIITCYKILAFSATLPAFSSAISKRQQQKHFSSANATLSYFSSRKISMDDTLLTYYQMRKNGLLPPFSVLDACGLK